MVQIVQKPPSFGETFGSGLSQGLQQLAQNKLQEILKHNQRSQAAKLYENAGLPKELAQSIVRQPESIQKSLLDRLEGLQFGGQQPQQLQQPNVLQQLTTPQQQLGQVAQPGLEPAREVSAPIQEAVSSGLKLGPSIAERRHRELLELKKEGMEQKRQAEAFKATKQERSEIIKAGRKAKQQLEDLNRMEELEKEGNLDTPGYIEFLKRSGLDIPALMDIGSEEFNKIAANFIGGAKDALGGRVTNFELEQFLKTIPSLSQSPEGRKRVIANLKRIKRTEVEYKKALKDVMSENKGVPPLDLLEKIDDKIGPRLDKISEKFRKDLSKNVPEGQNRLITAAQSIGGSIAGAPGRLLGGISHLLGGA